MIRCINFIVMSGVPGSGKTTLCQFFKNAKVMSVYNNQNIVIIIEYDKLIPTIEVNMFKNYNNLLKNLRCEILKIIKVFIICLFKYLSKHNNAQDIQHFTTFFKDNIGIHEDSFEQSDVFSNLIQLIHKNFITQFLTQIENSNIIDFVNGSLKIEQLWILFDDNMIHLSMKEEVVKMALELSDVLAINFPKFKIEISAIFICLICKLDTAKLRNQNRLSIENKQSTNINFNNCSPHVNSHTIFKMYQLQQDNLLDPRCCELKIKDNGQIKTIVEFIKCFSYEIPTDAIKQPSMDKKNIENVFDQFFHIVQKTLECQMTKNNIVNLDLVLKTYSAERQILTYNSKQSKSETSKNVLHQLDKALRRHISKHYQFCKESEDGSNNNIHFYNGIKNQILLQVRNKDISVVSENISQIQNNLEEFKFKVFDRGRNLEIILNMTELFEKFMQN